VVGLEIANTGASAALAPIAKFCIKLGAGFASDKVKKGNSLKN
jgi:hypothetical protein